MDKSKFKNVIKTSLLGALIAIFILTILFAAFATIVVYSNISTNIIPHVTTALGIIALFISSFIVSRIINKNGLLIGFIFGISTSILIFILTFFRTGIIFSVEELTKIISITIASCLGGIFGVNSKD